MWILQPLDERGSAILRPVDAGGDKTGRLHRYPRRAGSFWCILHIIVAVRTYSGCGYGSFAALDGGRIGHWQQIKKEGNKSWKLSPRCLLA
jgi:hypothetical protein